MLTPSAICSLSAHCDSSVPGPSTAPTSRCLSRPKPGRADLTSSAGHLLQGLAAYVLANNPQAKDQGLVVGHDHRYNSKRWAELTAAVFLERDIKVVLYNGLVHTPMVPFGVKTLGAAVGVMITASHNPKNDNGYKVYWSNAIQIISPHDTGIAAAILDNLQPTVSWDTSAVRANPRCEDRTEEMKDLYFEHVSSLSRTRTTNPTPPVSFVYTAMHGVGTPFLQRAFKTFEFPQPDLCKEQTEPDPEFPTVPFPNPEEKGSSTHTLCLYSSCLILTAFHLARSYCRRSRKSSIALTAAGRPSVTDLGLFVDVTRTSRWLIPPRLVLKSSSPTTRTQIGSPPLSEMGESSSSMVE